MRMSLRGIPAVFLLGMSLTGCGDLGNRPAPATVSPELPRVTVEVKGMSWPSAWGSKVRSALETLPWVEKGTIEPNTSRQQVRFAVKDKSEFKLDEVKRVIAKKGFEVGEVLSGPW